MTDFITHIGMLLVIAGAILLYVASRAALDALHKTRAPSPRRAALAHWLPIAAVALGALLMKRPEISVGVVFATSVASLSLVIGVITVMAPRREQHMREEEKSRGFEVIPVESIEAPKPVIIDPIESRLWPFVLPASILTLVAGFSAGFTWTHALALIMQGLVILPLARRDESNEHPDADPAARARYWRYAEFALAAILGILGAWAAVRGTIVLGDTFRDLPTGLLAATVLSWVLVLPMVGAGLARAHLGGARLATGVSVGVTLLNLCVLLPILTILWHTIPQVESVWLNLTNPPLKAEVTTRPTTETIVEMQEEAVSPVPANPNLPYPIAVWRMDNVSLVILGFLLIPVALGRFTLGRVEGFGLVIGYGFYLAFATMLGIR